MDAVPAVIAHAGLPHRVSLSEIVVRATSRA